VPIVTDDAGPVPYLESVAAQYLGDEPVRTRAKRPPATTEAATREAATTGPNAARMALGLASLAAQRLRGGMPVGDGLVTGVGLAMQTADGLRDLGRRVLRPTSRIAAGTVKGAALLPVAGIPFRIALRTRAWLGDAVSDARARGHETLEAGRADAERVLRRGVDRSVRWASDRAAAPLVERLAPRVAEHVVPRVIEELAEKVEPAGSGGRGSAASGGPSSESGGRRRR
jgi:hypothetical protein